MFGTFFISRLFKVQINLSTLPEAKSGRTSSRLACNLRARSKQPPKPRKSKVKKFLFFLFLSSFLRASHFTVCHMIYNQNNFYFLPSWRERKIIIFDVGLRFA